MTQHDTMAHIDDVQRHSRIEVAWRLIYKKNFMVNSTAVEKILQDMSLIPMAVRRLLLLFTLTTMLTIGNDRMHFPTGYFLLVSIFT